MTLAPKLPMTGVLLMGAAVVVVMSGCNGTNPDEPPEISYGRDSCQECHMIISDTRFAAAYRTRDGAVRKFDDPGDMVIFAVRNGELDGAKVWVHDYNTREWVRADVASFVHGAVETPMSRELVAFANEGPATELAGRVGGSVLKWNAVVGLARGGRLDSAVHTEPSPKEGGTVTSPATTGRNT